MVEVGHFRTPEPLSSYVGSLTMGSVDSPRPARNRVKGVGALLLAEALRKALA
jgi:hypothetical protein